MQISSVHGLARRLTDGRHLDLIERVRHRGRRPSDGLAPAHGCEGITGGGRAAIGVDGDDGIDGGIDRSTKLDDHQIVDVVVAVVFVDVNHLVLLSGVAIGTSCHAADAGEGGDGVVVLVDETYLGAVDVLTMGRRDDEVGGDQGAATKVTTPFREGNDILVSVGIGDLSATDDIPDDIAGPFIRLRPSVALNVSLAGCLGGPLGGKSSRSFSYLLYFLWSRGGEEYNMYGVSQM